MIKHTLSKALLAAILAVCSLSVAVAADKEKKPELLTGASASMLGNTCAGCHGSDGASSGPASPTIAGLSKDYFVETMQGFASDEIPSTIMGRIAKGYSDEEFKLMADYFGNKPFVKAKQSYDAALAEEGAKLHEKYCEKCHGDGGQSAEDDAGVLAGQWTPYVTWTLADYKAGDREASKKMKKKLQTMLDRKGNKGLDALINYYASQQK
jgi:sulfide dehydrogenase cytochrome subunit